MYLTFEEYQTLGGDLTEAQFKPLEYQGETIINYVTFNRLKNDSSVSDDVKQCMLQLISLLVLKMQSLSLGASSDGTSQGAISSQSNDGFSIQFNSLSAQTAYELSKTEMNSIVARCLASVTNDLGQKVLYRGYYPNE